MTDYPLRYKYRAHKPGNKGHGGSRSGQSRIKPKGTKGIVNRNMVMILENGKRKMVEL